MEKKYYKLLDIIRVVSCIGVLLYHLGYLKGGFLSVCAFFVLSGYLSYLSLSRKEKVSLKEYYQNRFLHIYLPLLAVVFLTTCIVSFIPVIHWFQLKPETSSVLFGYNNYWQLSVHADYFARHVSSPFMHFWYIGILLQFELIFPFLYYVLKFCREKIGKIVPVILLEIATILSCFYFLHCHDIMVSYYDTLARCFSLFLGVFLGYIHKEYASITFKKFPNIFFFGYLLLFIVIQFIVDANSSYYAIMMILTSLITCRMIDYATTQDSESFKVWDQEIKYLSGVSYEVYLFQYPVIFFFQYLELSPEWELPIMIIIIFILSYLLHFCLNFKSKYRYLRLVFDIVLFIFCLYGLIQYVVAKDYTNDINDLRAQLASNEKLIESKQKDYETRLKQENDEWNSVLQDLENGEKELASYVTNLPVVAVGDSVMLGAVPTLYETFPNGNFDAAVNRTDYEANRILLSFKNNGLLSNDIVIHLGTNGQCGLACQREIMATCEDRHVFIVTVSNDYEVHVNQSFYELANLYPNITIIDWFSAANGHSEYFAADGVHLTGYGMSAYSQTIYNGIYQYYFKEFEEKRNKVLKEHEEKMNARIDFYGNQVLLNVYQPLQNEYQNSRFVVQEEFTISDLLSKLKKEIDNQTISKSIIVAIDQTNDISKTDYEKIVQLAKDQNVYFLFIYHEPFAFKEENISTLNFYKEMQNHSDYFMVDGVHLSDKGNQKLIQFIQNSINKKD